MFEYEFMWKALIAGVAIAVAAALLGTSLVLKRNSMIGDGLAHVSFGAMAVAVAVGVQPLLIAIPVSVAASVFLLSLNERHRGDSAIAMLSAVALAIGVVAVSLSGTNIDINSYMFGSILAISDVNLVLSLGLVAIVGVFFAKYRKQIFALTIDETFARAIGIRTRIYNMVFAALASVVIVLGMKLLGVLLVSSLIVFPNITAKYLARSFRSHTVLAVIIASVSFVLGLVFSYFLDIPTGPSVVVVSAVIYGFVRIISKLF